MPQTIPSEGGLSAGSADALDGRWLGLVLGMLVLPMYVALGAPSVALPAIGRALGVRFGATAWILAAWSLASALAMPVVGRLMARWSPFRVLVAGVVALAAGSALAAVGPTLPVVIVGRTDRWRRGGCDRDRRLRRGHCPSRAGTAACVGNDRGRQRDGVGVRDPVGRSGRRVAGVACRARDPGPRTALLLAAWAGRRTFTRIGRGERDGSAGRLDIVGAAVLSVLAGSLITLLQAHSVGLPAPVTLVVAAAGALAAVGLWWRVRRTPDGFVPRRVLAARGFLAAGLVGGAVFAGYYGVLFLAPSLIEQATGGGALEAGALLVPAAACSVLAGRLVGGVTDRFTAWQVLAGLAALTVVGVLVVAVFDGPFPVVVGVALTVCGFAGAQAVLVGLAPELVATRDRDTAQGLLNFMIVLGGGIGPAAVAGLSGIVSVPVALAVLAALPLAGLVLSLTRRPGARHPPEPHDIRTERRSCREKEPDCGRRAV